MNIVSSGIQIVYIFLKHIEGFLRSFQVENERPFLKKKMQICFFFVKEKKKFSDLPVLAYFKTYL